MTKKMQYYGSYNGLHFSRKSHRKYTDAVVTIACHERVTFETLEPCPPYLLQIHYCGSFALALKQVQRHDLGFWEGIVERHIVPLHIEQ